MTRHYHDMYRNHLIRGEYRDKKRPILINNWEATYFDFNTENVTEDRRAGIKLGIEMLVMDDGWFGHRMMTVPAWVTGRSMNRSFRVA